MNDGASLLRDARTNAKNRVQEGQLVLDLEAWPITMQSCLSIISVVPRTCTTLLEPGQLPPSWSLSWLVVAFTKFV